MTKRFVSLLMALMLIIGIFAVPAMATSPDDGVEPCGIVISCPHCYASITMPPTQTWAENGTVYVGCSKTSELHAHFKSWRVTGWQCPSCGLWTETNRVTVTDTCSIGMVS